MAEKEQTRFVRLSAILIQLQTKKLVTASEISAKFGISVRTVYRDIRALEEAGVPVYSEEGKGYSLMEGYNIPPVMFTENEANAMITAQQLVLKNKDASFVQDFSNAVLKIRSVLRQSTKNKADLLSKRIVFRQNSEGDITSNLLSPLQTTLTNFRLTKINYQSPEKKEPVWRTVEPFALYSTQDNWLLIAWCRLRNDYRSFRLDRIQNIEVLDEVFEPHKITLPEYFEICRQKTFSNP